MCAASLYFCLCSSYWDALRLEKMISLAMEREVTTGVEKYCCHTTSACEIHSHLTARDYFPYEVFLSEGKKSSYSQSLLLLLACSLRPQLTKNTKKVNRNKEKIQKKRRESLNTTSIFEDLFYVWLHVLCVFLSVVMCR